MKKQIVRQIDETGRLVLPKPFREMLGLRLRDKAVITLEDDAIVVRSCSDTCVFCGHGGALDFAGTPICANCAKKIGRLAE